MPAIVKEKEHCARLAIEIVVDDPEVVEELVRCEPGPERNAFAVRALRLGVQVLRQARGALDAETIRAEGQRAFERVSLLLREQSEALVRSMAATLGSYFDPRTGHLPQRLERLLARDGDLERALAAQLHVETSPLARTLGRYLGDGSPVLKLLAPDQKGNVVDRLGEAVRASLEAERQRLAGEFSLDRPDSALSRLVREVKGQVLELAQKDERFQSEVRATLQGLAARREEAARSTRHGLAFQDALAEQVQKDAQRTGDTVGLVNNTPGELRFRKVGDFVLELGPESAAPGERIAIEAKEEKRYDVPRALEEAEVAKKNRGAEVGVFVFSARTAPPGLEPLKRYGSTIVARWDAEDPATDVFLAAALSLARALAIRRAQDTRGDTAVDRRAVEDALNAVEQEAKRLDQVRTWAETVQSNGAKIVEAAKKAGETLLAQVDALRAHVPGLRPV